MKRPYTLFTPEYRELIKRGVTPSDARTALVSALRNPDPIFLGELQKRLGSDPQSAIEDAPTESFAWEMDRHIMQGDAVHWFLPGNEFCEWLASCAKATSPENLISVMIDSTKPANEISRQWDKQTRMSVVVLHFPTESKRRSTSFCLGKVVDRENMFQLVEHPSYVATAEYDWARVPFTLGEKIELSEKVWEGNYQLFMGACLYISAFPDAFRPGLPDDLKHPSHHKHGEAFTIGIDERVKSIGTHGSPTPHFRVGHFRVLKSERFTHKRFEVVFVHETFVKGRAVTVLSPEQVPV